MADVSSALGAYLVTQGIVAGPYPRSSGVPYSLDFMPADSDSCVAFYEDSAGTSPIEGTVKVAVQVSVRDNSAGTARTRAWAIHDLLARSGFTVSGVRYTTQARGVPAKLDEDSTGRTVYVLNLIVVTAS